ncbi:hypothetical protein [Streptomyces sp. NPDC015125]|uniref:hypothetical protein n=1 Tax=Streptomyces sp. NPDC015125 TaxID=3364938 RepID=UPI0037019418
MGDFYEDLAENIKAGNTTLDKSWNAKAADAAYIYFETLSKGIEEMKNTFVDLKENHEKPSPSPSPARWSTPSTR